MFMNDMDTLIPNLTDGNANTAWISYGFGTANYAGTIKEFGLALKLHDPTVVSKLTIQQNTGTGGSLPSTPTAPHPWTVRLRLARALEARMQLAPWTPPSRAQKRAPT